MKRVLFFVAVAVAYCLAPSAGLGQGWTPGAPPSAMPYADVTLPGMGQPGLMPDIGGSCAPMPQCGPMPCGPSRPASIAGLIGWQFASDPGGIKLSTRGHEVIDRTGTRLDFDLSGLWIGVSSRMQASEGVSVRGEYRHFFPSEDHCEDTTTYINTTAPIRRVFTRNNLHWNVLDGSVGCSVACGVSLLGGVRWDSFRVSLSHAPLIFAASSNEDEGDLTLSTIIPYGGAEFASIGCEWGMLLRIIGAPWMSTWTDYGLTYGNGGDFFRGPIRDRIQVSSKYASFVEASLHVGRKFSCNVTASAFGTFTSLFAHSKGDLESTLMPGFEIPGWSSSSPYDVDWTRCTVMLGGNVAVGFSSPL
jgi:hypothetical protein